MNKPNAYRQVLRKLAVGPMSGNALAEWAYPFYAELWLAIGWMLADGIVISSPGPDFGSAASWPGSWTFTLTARGRAELERLA